MFSKIAHYDYQIECFIPDETPPADGFPVLFVLDGTRYSLLIAQALKNQARNRVKTKVEPMIIVGIGHNEENLVDRRFYDFTAPAHSYKFPVRYGKELESRPVGGAEKFHSFLTEELLPNIIRQYPINEEKISLYGHSLGGLFVLWSYLTYPALFSRYAALSPSLWWNEHELLKTIAEAKGNFHQPLYITVGGDEGDMVKDAQRFFEEAKRLYMPAKLFVAEEENHASVIPTTISLVLRFISNK